MADYEMIKWAHRYAETIGDRTSLKHARDFLLKGVQSDVDAYVMLAEHREYLPDFVDGIRQGLEALSLVAKGLNR